MDEHRTCRLIVVTAPAGYGKSTFLTMWGKHTATMVAWVSLDEMDNDLSRFWSTVVESVKTIAKRALRRSVSILHVGGPLGMDALLSAFITDLKQYEQDITIILDDYHMITDVSIHHSVEHLMKHLPHHVHLVVVSRKSLPFSLGRLRAQGQVAEIGTNELRFTADETRDFYRKVMHMALPDTVINGVARVTEGWVSGLQLATMAMQGEQDLSNLLSKFGGGHRLVADFLNEEVLLGLTDVVQNFLLETSILNRMNGPLCVALTGVQEAQEILRELHLTNSFVIALDEDLVWYRYHHLFSDYLRQRLGKQDVARVLHLHRRAAEWFHSQGFIAEAIEHAIQAEDFTFAAYILEINCAKLLHAGELITLLQWFERIPDSTLEQHPLARVLHGWVLTLLQRLEPALQVVANARESLPSQPQTVDVQEIELELDVLRGYIAILQRDTSLAVECFTSSVRRSPKYSRFFLRGVNLNTGEPFVLPSRLGMRGYLNSVFELYTALRQLWKHSGLLILGYGSAALGELYYEWNQFDHLNYFIPRGLDLGKTVQDVGILVPLYLLHAKYLRARGMRVEMWESVRELEVWLQNFALAGHWQDLLMAFKVRLWIEENQADKVFGWLDSNLENQHESVAAVGEYSMITMARVLIYAKRWNPASRLLSKLLHYAETEDRLTSKIEVSLLQTMVYGAENDALGAMAALHRAVHWAMPENYQRIFIDEGEALVHWLRNLSVGTNNLTSEETHYVNALVATFDADKFAQSGSIGGMTPEFGTLQDSYIEPLTNREREILNAIGLGLQNAEIAQRLGLSVGTVKLYVHNIFGKLGVKNRTHAVAKARALSLLSRADIK
jgi:LuxR family transcriptional regulator, maltose regulon positive regulatory protein